MTTGRVEPPAGEDPRTDPAWNLVRAAADHPLPPPPGLVDRVLRSVNGARGRLSSEPLAVRQDRGWLRVRERALVALCRQAGVESAQRIGGVAISAVGMTDDGFVVEIAVRFGVAADVAAERLRADVHQRVTDLVGLPIGPVNVVVVDVRR